MKKYTRKKRKYTRKKRKRKKRKKRKKKEKETREFFEKIAEPAFEYQWGLVGGGNPQKDLYDGIKENNELGVQQALNNGGKINHIKEYEKLATVDGELIMKRGKTTPLMEVVRGKASGAGGSSADRIGIANQILGNRVGKDPGINLEIKDPYYDPPKNALQMAEAKVKDNPTLKELVEVIKERAGADAGKNPTSPYSGEGMKKVNEKEGTRIQKIAMEGAMIGGRRRTRKKRRWRKKRRRRRKSRKKRRR